MLKTPLPAASENPMDFVCSAASRTEKTESRRKEKMSLGIFFKLILNKTS